VPSTTALVILHRGIGLLWVGADTLAFPIDLFRARISAVTFGVQVPSAQKEPKGTLAQSGCSLPARFPGSLCHIRNPRNCKWTSNSCSRKSYCHTGLRAVRLCRKGGPQVRRGDSRPALGRAHTHRCNPRCRGRSVDVPWTINRGTETFGTWPYGSTLPISRRTWLGTSCHRARRAGSGGEAG
jgi:hypothetical protein